MKKYYLLLAGLGFYGSMVSQQVVNPFSTRTREVETLAPDAKIPGQWYNNAKREAGPFTYFTEPIGDYMLNQGYQLSGASANQTIFLDNVFCDSTVKTGSGTNTNRFVESILMGSILDPKSENLLPTFEPICTYADDYRIDSVFIRGSYVKVTPAVDTLYVWMVWGAPNNSNIFKTRTTSSVWVSPISTWRTSITGAALSGATGAAGNKIKCAAPTTNYKLVKYVLTDSDSSRSGRTKFIGVEVGVDVPKGTSVANANIVSCFYTFVPGGAYNLGDCSYSFSGAAVTQNINGFAGAIWEQTFPAVNSVSNYVNHQVDATSWCMSNSYSKDQRHAVYSATYTNSLFGNLTTAPIIVYKISGISTQGVEELGKDRVVVKQNTPNPAYDYTNIAFELAGYAKKVSLNVYDLTGKLVKTLEKDGLSGGVHSIKVDTDGMQSGVYYYSLTMDNYTSAAKKMVVVK